MVILGVSAYHGDSSAAILRDGRIVAAAEEERFTRLKHWAGFPAKAIAYCLSEAGVALPDVDYIAVSRDPAAQLLRKAVFVLRRRTPWKFVSDRLRKRSMLLSLDKKLAEHFGTDAAVLRPKMRHVEHHLAHVCSAFFASPFDEAALLSIDAFGDWTSTLLGGGEGNRVNVHKRVFFPHSLGVVYTAVTQFLGFPQYGDEYKVMGLAPYGEPKFMDSFRRIVRDRGDGTFRLNMKYFIHQEGSSEMSWESGVPVPGRLYSDAMAELFGPPREPQEPLTDHHKHVAASLQAFYEEVFFSILRALHDLTGSPRLCLSGGCAMNSVANGKIFERSPFKEVYIPPQPGDGGGAVGAAVYVHFHQMKQPVLDRPMTAFLGPRFDRPSIQSLLDTQLAGRDEKFQIETLEEDVLCESVAQDISEGKVVGWFQDRMEWGPRALGNRSILADPRRADMKDILNLKIKRRESFRPFAPSILKEATAEFFETDYDVPYMSMVFQIRPEKRSIIPAVTHVNGSGRLQTVRRQENPLYWKLIHAFGRKTGVPIVLNTSFNENEPIVCSPAEALDCFLRTKMDTLALGQTVLRRKS